MNIIIFLFITFLIAFGLYTLIVFRYKKFLEIAKEQSSKVDDGKRFWTWFLGHDIYCKFCGSGTFEEVSIKDTKLYDLICENCKEGQNKRRMR